MKKFTRYILCFFFAVSLLGTTSCEDWLDVTSTDQVRGAKQFQHEAGFKDGLMGIYIGMAEESLYGKEMTWHAVDIMSQQYNELPPSTSFAPLQVYNYQANGILSTINSFWSNSYNLIANINNELKYIDKNKDVLHPLNHDLIKGELLGLRAFLHFDLIRLYGKGNLANRSGEMSDLTIPYATTYTKNKTKRRSYSETFDMMRDDINKGLELLKEDPIYDTDHPDDYYQSVNQEGFYDNRKIRMNYYALEGLKARVLAWIGGQQNMDEAGKAAKDVINHAPVHLIDPNTYEVRNDPILYPEMTFGIQVDNFKATVETYLDASSSVTNLKALYLSPSMTNEIYETDNVNIGPPDIRYNTLLESENQGYACIKLSQEDPSYNDELEHHNIMPLIKLPEMYYIAAEADLDDNLSQSIDYLNTVRSSFGIIQEIDENATGQEVREEITKEYRKQFVMRGQLFFYYKRLGKEQIPGYSQTTSIGDDIYVLPYPDDEVRFQ